MDSGGAPRARDLGARRVAAPVQPSADFDPAEGAGLFVGIRHFATDPQLAPVEFAVDDAVDLAHAFACELSLLTPDRLRLCLEGEPQKPGSRARLEGLRAAGAAVEDADQSTIYRALEAQVRLGGARGLFVLSIATHGFQQDGADYLVAANSLRSRIVRTGISLAELLEECGRAAPARRLVLLDACRERLERGSRSVAADARTALSATFARAIAGAQGQAVLAAAVEGGYAYDDPAAGNGVFTAALLAGLRGGAEPDPRGLITVEQLARFTNGRVADWVRRHAGMPGPGGISFQLSGDAARLPLACHPEVRADYESFRTRRQHLVGVLGQAMRFRVLRGEMVEEVRAFLDRVEEPPAAEPILRRIERIEREGEEAAEDFVAWWRARRSEAHAAPALPSPPPAVLPVSPALPPAASSQAVASLAATATPAPQPVFPMAGRPASTGALAALFVLLLFQVPLIGVLSFSVSSLWQVYSEELLGLAAMVLLTGILAIGNAALVGRLAAGLTELLGWTRPRWLLSVPGVNLVLLLHPLDRVVSFLPSWVRLLYVLAMLVTSAIGTVALGQRLSDLFLLLPPIMVSQIVAHVMVGWALLIEWDRRVALGGMEDPDCTSRIPITLAVLSSLPSAIAAALNVPFLAVPVLLALVCCGFLSFVPQRLVVRDAALVVVALVCVGSVLFGFSGMNDRHVALLFGFAQVPAGLLVTALLLWRGGARTTAVAPLALLLLFPASGTFAQTPTPDARAVGASRYEGITAPVAPAAPTRQGAVLWALLVDVGDYEDDTIADLPATEADMDALAATFAAMPRPAGGRPFADVVTWRLSATKPGMKSADRPKTRQLRELFEGPMGILNVAQSGDTVLLFFGGHGMTPEGDAGGRRQQYLLPMNADPQDLASTAIPLSDFLGWLEVLEKKGVRATLFLDACRTVVLLPPEGRSGIPQRRGTMTNEFLEEIERAQGTAIYTAVREAESAFNDEFTDPFDPATRRSYGVFTRTVVDGLLGAADSNGDGAVTLSELSTYTTPAVIRHVQSRRLGSQTPSLKQNEVSGELVLGLVPALRTVESFTPAATPATAPEASGEGWLLILGGGGCFLVLLLLILLGLILRSRTKPSPTPVASPAPPPPPSHPVAAAPPPVAAPVVAPIIAPVMAVVPPAALAALATAQPLFQARCWSDRAGAPAPVTRDIAARPRQHSARYRIGESVRLYVQVERDCHVALLNLGSSGRVTILLPNAVQRQPRLRPGEVLALPGADWGFDLEQQGPPGRERLVLLASLEPFPAAFQPPAGEFFAVLPNAHALERELRPFYEAIRRGTAWSEARCEWEVEG